MFKGQGGNQKAGTPTMPSLDNSKNLNFFGDRNIYRVIYLFKIIYNLTLHNNTHLEHESTYVE